MGLCHELNRTCAWFSWGLVRDREKILSEVGRKYVDKEFGGVWLKDLEVFC